MTKLSLTALLAATCLGSGIATAQAPKTDWSFTFGSAATRAGSLPVSPTTTYSSDTGYGIEPNANLPAPGVAPMAPVTPTIQSHNTLITSDKTFIFSSAIPEGNYRITLTLGAPDTDTTTTVKAEARRLMLEHLQIPKGQILTKSFLINVRRPEVSPGITVKLDPRESGSFTWDDKLSLEFCPAPNAHTALSALEIHKIDDAITVYLCGDSTVTDQPREPYGSWGQMLPRWFNDRVAVANYAESGETLKAFMKERRWDKVMSLVKKGDYVFMQFGNNDMQTSGHNAMWPADDHEEDWAAVHSAADTDYQTILKDWSAQVKAKGAIPVIVSPYTKSRAGAPDPAGLRGYPAAAAKAAKDSNAAFLDLNAISTDVLTALGPANGALAYVDGQHTRSYGAYMNSRSVIFGIQQLKLDLASFVTPDAVFDPQHPLPLPADFDIPLEPAPSFGRGPRSRGPASAPSTNRGN